MINGFSVENWLSERSHEVRRSNTEIVFLHQGGDKSCLLLHTTEEANDRLIVNSALEDFYGKYSGGFIGNGYILIGSPKDESLSTSAGIAIPSIHKIRAVSERLGVFFEQSEIPFMTIGYMFIYSVTGAGKLCCHDRDFHTTTEDQTVCTVLENWWTMKLADECK